MYPFHIAIDGPLAAGKGTVSKLLAEKINFVYVDTGAMYRMTALLAIQHQVDLKDESAVSDLVAEAAMDMHAPTLAEKDGRLSTIVLNGEDVSWKIRTEEISRGSSMVAQYKKVREQLVAKQQAIAVGKDVVMEGRDITYRVLPDAQLKIFLTASDTVRAKRRHTQLLTKGENTSFETVYEDMVKRDAQDMQRSVDPLQIVPEAWVVDTSELSIDEVVQLIESRVKSMQSS